MKKIILKITALGLFAAAMVAAPTVTRAADTTTPAAAAPVKAKKGASLVFTGKVGTIDTNAMTLVVGKRTFNVTSETKITKDGQPATLADGVAGETVSGAYKKGTDGKLAATTVTYTTKASGTKKANKKAAPASAGSTTNSITK
jgi:hypothetical protein